jgi:hypothetical protein
MTRSSASTTGPQSRQQSRADSENWQEDVSARSLAYYWEEANGLPPEVRLALATAADGAFTECTPFLAVPEFETDLPESDRVSPGDLLVLGHASGGPFVIAVEGKVSGSFGPALGDWRKDASGNRQERWAFLCSTLGIPERQPDELRYHLFHRAASAVLAAHRLHSRLAVQLVHSFSEDQAGWPDFNRFMSVFDVTPHPNSVTLAKRLGPMRFYAGWAVGSQEACHR